MNEKEIVKSITELVKVRAEAQEVFQNSVARIQSRCDHPRAGFRAFDAFDIRPVCVVCGMALKSALHLDD